MTTMDFWTGEIHRDATGSPWERIYDMAHRSANGDKRIGDLRFVMRRIRDIALDEVAAEQKRQN